jgi:hypothetical protein
MSSLIQVQRRYSSPNEEHADDVGSSLPAFHTANLPVPFPARHRLGDSARGSAHLAPRSPVMKKASPRSMKERRSSERKDFALLFQNRLMGRDRMEQTHVTPGEIAPDALTTF